jgi:CheY-like chemotaxis protein
MLLTLAERTMPGIKLSEAGTRVKPHEERSVSPAIGGVVVPNNNVRVERTRRGRGDSVSVNHHVDAFDIDDIGFRLGLELAGGTLERLSGFYPSEESKGSPGLPPAPGAPQPSAGLGGLRVLVVEDDPDARELVSAILEDAGAVVESAPSAATGFAALSTFHPQLLVSDIGMPDEDGYSLIRRVRALGEAEGGRIPSIALTAYTRPEDRAKALGAGFTLHMGKPISPVALVSAIKNLATRQPHN